jgi:hypothetical protein
MHFEHFCDAVRPVSIGMKDGSDFTARFCKRQIYAPEGKGFQIEGAQRSLQSMSSETVFRTRVWSSILVWSADTGGDENLQQMMRRVGYGDRKVDDFLFARSGINSPTDRMYQERPTPSAEDYWEYFVHLAVSYESQDRSEFLRRVMQLTPQPSN